MGNRRQIVMSVEGKYKFVMLNPTADLWKVEGKKGPGSKNAVFRFSMLPSLYVCASMPDWIEPRIIDEDVEPIPDDLDADIVGITFMTYNAEKAYDLGDHFMEKGKTVIFGGYHPTFMPDEAEKHCDSICIGEAEVSVPKMMEDWRAGKLKRRYRSGRIDLKGLPIPDRSLLKKKAYIMPNAVQATRGCPNSCDFCSVSMFYEHEHRKRPIKEVVDEIRSLKGRYMIFIDDNLTADRDYAVKLFKAIAPLKRIWYAQTSIKVALDEELLEAAANAGAKGFFIGIESLSQDILDASNKRFCKAEDYERAIKNLHDHGIGIMASVVFGWDEDDLDVFEKTADFLERTNVDNLQSTIYTPFPGTLLMERLKNEGRIIDTTCTKYDFSHAVFEPRNMTKDQLEEGFCYVMARFYSPGAILKRTLKQLRYSHPWHSVRVSLALSLGYRQRIKSKGFTGRAKLHGNRSIRNKKP